MRRRTLTILAGLTLVAGGLTAATPAGSNAAPVRSAARVVSMSSVVPRPVSVRPDPGHSHRIGRHTRIHVQARSAGAASAARYLAGFLRRSTGFALPIRKTRSARSGGISLLLSGAPRSVGPQGYKLVVNHAAVVIRARRPAGLYNGIQTLHQLLPAKADAKRRQPSPWRVAAGVITDHPRYRYRGAMLDVARHFFGVHAVKHYIDEIALYKINYLHLHLSDDQGWRIAINGWPRLTRVGGATEIGGGHGGYYSQPQYRSLVAYARSRNITIIPEIDMPGHANAAVHAYGKLGCSGKAAPAYTKIGSPNTSLCVDKKVSYRFINTVVGQLAAMTPGRFIDVGGDEAITVGPHHYQRFITHVQRIVNRHHKTLLGWHQIIGGHLTTGTVAQDWSTTHKGRRLARASRHGIKLIMSPASHVYLDQKYNKHTKLGLSWAGHVSVSDSYAWDPGRYLHGGNPSAVIGVEAPLWTETISDLRGIQFMAFPRLPAVAEVGWSPRSAHNWGRFADRLGRQAPRWRVMGINYYRAPRVRWS